MNTPGYVYQTYDIKIIGIDHGYGNMKTANHCFKTGILGFDSEPLFTRDMLVYNSRYYLIGEGHKEFLGRKTENADFYLLTLAAMAMELRDAGLTEADVLIAAGLPLTWTAGQKEKFAAYLGQNEEVRFTFRKADYLIRVRGVAVYPQGFAAVANRTAHLSLRREGEPLRTLVGESVVMTSLAAAVELETGETTRVLCPTELHRGILGPMDLSVEGEEAMKEALSSAGDILADPMYRYVAPETARFRELPHLAFSGRMYRRRYPDLFGEEISGIL